MNITPCVLGGILGISCLQAAPSSFFAQSGNHSSLNGALDGTTVADQLGLSPYDGFVGELALIPVDSSALASVPSGTAGMITADNGGTFSNRRGLAGFCIDSETGFLTSSSSSSSQHRSYEALSFSSANARYLSEGTHYYLADGLKRAAYLLENFYNSAHNGSDVEAAALQSAIWEVLYDSNPNVSLNQGNYFIRTDVGNNSAKNTAKDVAAQANSWLTAAKNANWGGSTYDPANRVLFWLDPNNSQLNQSIITLNPANWTPTPVPEAEGVALFAGSFGLLLLVRRRK